MDVVVLIQLSAEEEEKILRPVVGQGGHQSLLRKLQSQIQHNQLTLSLDDIRRIKRYSFKYGEGGFQQRLRAVYAALSRLANSLRFP